jgi:hypothetical protein
VAQYLLDPLEEREFELIKRHQEQCNNHTYSLVDFVAGIVLYFLVTFFNQIESLGNTLPPLFTKRPGDFDKVLERIKRDDWGLVHLTDNRPELAESHDQFCKVIDKINDSGMQEVLG